ncbi:LysE family translocator [Pseudomonas sp.]|uniref:LysE family translocator n=1 Tax=Pseudomonas sp. TaxID=306 RepID=UPI003D6E33F0
MDLQQVLTFLPAAVVIACVPGANNLLSFENGARWGIKVAVYAVLGRCLAYALMIGLVVAGLGRLLEASEVAFLTIKWVGVAYLLWIGIGMLRSSPASQANTTSSIHSPTGGRANTFIQARKDFLVALGNPKAVLLFSALLPQFVVQSSETSYSTQMAILGLIYSMVEWGTASLYSILGKLAVVGTPTVKRLSLVQRVSGSMMLLMAGALAFTKRSSA